jgi:ZIP family zinc transporter
MRRYASVGGIVTADLGNLLVFAGIPALASLVGGVLALLYRPSTLIASIIFGFAGGGLIGTVAFEMLPRGVELTGLGGTVVSFGIGFVAVYLFDLIVHRGVVAGEHASQHRRVVLAYRRRPPHGGAGAVLAGATSVEEIIEGLTIGISLSVAPSLALIVGLAIVLDNVSEGLAIGEMLREEMGGDGRRARVAAIGWTTIIGLALFVPAAVAWLLLRDIPAQLHGLLVAGGAGAMMYLSLSDLLPEGQTRQYQQSSAIAAGTALMVILVVSALAKG